MAVTDDPDAPSDDLPERYAGTFAGTSGCEGVFGGGDRDGIEGGVGSREGDTGSVKGMTMCRRTGTPISIASTS